MMNEVMGKGIVKCCLVYLDEVLIPSSTRETHFRDFKLVCFHPTAVPVRLKWEKCRVVQLEVEDL